MPKKNIEERIIEIEQQLKIFEEKKKELLSQKKDKDRKERTRRLIQIGAIMESFGLTTPEIAEAFKVQFINDPDILKWLDRLSDPEASDLKNNIIDSSKNIEPHMIFEFGKYQGKSILDIWNTEEGKQYCLWCLNNTKKNENNKANLEFIESLN